MHIINKKNLSFTNEANSYISQFVPKGAKDTNVTLNSLIDIFTILLIFLLKSYSSTGFTLPLTPGIKIPQANFSTDPAPAAILSISNEYISLDGRRVLFTKDMNPEEIGIDKLKEALISIKQNIVATGDLNKTTQFTGKIIIEGDREIPFKLLQKILFTCGQAGFDKIHLAVLKKT